MGEPVELVIFDCDGVLVDTERIGTAFEARYLTGLGWAITPEEIAERFVGRTADYMESVVEATLGDRLPAGWRNDFRRGYEAALDTELQPVDGVVEALDAIVLPTCVASSGSHAKMRHTLGRTGLWARFEGRVFSTTEVAHGKPAPDLFLYAADRMRTPPARCVVVEDSPYGVQAAGAAGMRVCAYAGGVTPAARLAGPDTVVFDDMRALPGLLAAA